MKEKVFKILFLLSISCSSSSNRYPRNVTEEDINYCKMGCDHLMTLPGRDGNQGCEEGRPLVYPSGEVESCEFFCRDTQINGRLLNPKCWLTVQSCSEIEKKCR